MKLSPILNILLKITLLVYFVSLSSTEKRESKGFTSLYDKLHVLRAGKVFTSCG